MKKTLFKASTLLPICWHSLRWHFHYYLKKSSFPLACGIFLTSKCNLRCSMCSIWGDANKSSISLEQLKSIVDSVTPGLCYLSFSGGEPLLVEDLYDMVAYASGKVPYVHLVSNGLLIDKTVTKDLSRRGLSEVSISLDGDREWHNTLRDSSKSFDAAIRAIECIKRHTPEIEVVVNSVIFPDKVDQVRKAVELTKQLKVKHKVQPVNNHFKFDKAISVPKPLDFRDADHDAIRGLINYLLQEAHVVNSKAFLKMIPHYFDGSLRCPMIEKKCFIPHFYLEVSAHGNASPCMLATEWGGTIPIGMNFREALNSDQYLSEKRRLEACKKCHKSMYICYWEPMISFPLKNLIQFGLS
jgi:MoaA/NifB/PqqE/SkfB family radical SAM enzyme